MPEQKDKERQAQLKALRRELEAELEERLKATAIASHASARGETKQSQGTETVSTFSGVASSPPTAAPRNDETSPRHILEALLFATARPLTVNEIRKLIADVGAGLKPALTSKQIETLITELREGYARDGRSFDLIEIAGGFEMVTKKEFAPWVGRLDHQKRARQASHSSLETLAILAYKQPVTRAEIEEIRGVDISGVLSTLLERGFIKIVGKKEVAGRPFLYGTTEKFLEHFGLKSMQDLPPIGEIKDWVERAVRKEEQDESESIAPKN